MSFPSWHNKTTINAAGLGHLWANIPHPSCFLPFCLHADTKTVPSTTQKVKCKPDVAKRSRPEEVFHSYKNTCPLQPYAIKITLPLFSSCINCGHFVRVSLDRELDIHDTHACTNTHKVHREEKNEKRRKKVIKISGRHWRGERSERPQQQRCRPPQQLASSVWKWACCYRGCRTVAMTLWLPWGHGATGQHTSVSMSVKNFGLLSFNFSRLLPARSADCDSENRKVNKCDKCSIRIIYKRIKTRLFNDSRKKSYRNLDIN